MANVSGAARHVVAVGNLKGGTGKSTVAVTLACALAERGSRVAIVDNDDQGTAMGWALRGTLPARTVHLPLPSLAQIEPWLRDVELLRSGHDAVVIDLPASVAPALAASFLLATVILVPTSPGAIDLAATRRMLARVARARQERQGQPPAVLVVPDRVMPAGPDTPDTLTGLASLGEALAPPFHQSSLFDVAFERGMWVGSLAPGSRPHREAQALAAVVAGRLAALPPAPALWHPGGSVWAGAGEASAVVETWRRPAPAQRRSWLERLLGRAPAPAEGLPG